MSYRWPTLILTIFALTVALLLGNRPALASDLDRVRKSASGTDSQNKEDEEEERSQKKRRKRRSRENRDRDRVTITFGDSDDDDDVSLNDLIGKGILFVAVSPWLLPPAMIGDQYSQDVELISFPYADNHDGYARRLNFDEQEFKTLGVRLTSEYGNDFSGLERIGGRLQLDTSSRFGIDTEWNHWREDVSNGVDTLWTGDANLTFRFAQSPHAQFYTGLGMNWMGGGHEDVGFNFTYGFDWFPTEPIVIRSVFDAGTLGDSDLYHSKTTIGLVRQHVELYAGYDILHLGETNLQGMIAGVSLWW